MKLDRLYDVGPLRLRSLWRKARVERELDHELRSHLDQQTRENLAKGMPPAEAEAGAFRAMGGFAQIQEECRGMRRTHMLESIWNDIRYAFRILGRTPGFTAIIVLTLALSIGANSAIFSLFEGVLLRPLPYPHAERIVRIFFKSDHFPKFPLNLSIFAISARATVASTPPRRSRVPMSNSPATANQPCCTAFA